MKCLKNKKGILTLIIAGFVAISASVGNDYFEVSKNLDIFASLYKELTSNYVEEIDPSQLMRTGIDAMVASLDPFTNFISEAEIENYRLGMTGKYGGIGALIRKQNDQIVIVEPNEGFPAHQAGLRAGDIILSVDGKSVEGKESSDVTDILRGHPGTEVTITVKRALENKEIKKTLTRQEIQLENVPYYGMIDNGVAYIKLTQFTNMAGKNVKNALTKLKEENDVKGIILDLRGNGGGLLSEAINVTNVFVDKDTYVVSTKGRIANSNRSFKTLYPGEDVTTPLAVLTDRSSASASEIVSGAVQDLDRGIVVGQRTYGKGLVQNTKNLNYQTKLKLTTARYYLPSGRYIQKIEYFFDKKNEADGAKKDSMGEPFKTKNGRTVYGGNGIHPDLSLDRKNLSSVSFSLLTNGHIFDFATNYVHKNPNASVEYGDIVSDKEFEEFKQYVSGKEYGYDTRSENLLEQLKKAADKEKYLDAINADLTTIEQKIKADKEKDLYEFKNEIKDLLNEEIAARYGYQVGRIQASLSHDKEVEKASALILNQSEYSKALGK